MIRVAIALLLSLIMAWPAQAHEVRPAFLEIRQTTNTTYEATWKQPTLGNVAVHLVPHLSNGWLEQKPDDQYAAAGFLIRTWKIEAPTTTSLSGVTVSIEGLQDTITDAFVRIRLKNGQAIDRIVRPEVPSFPITLSKGNAMSMSSFVLLGIEHILTGPDHLSFVLGLLLIVRDRWMLLKTVSAFTVAHSITLAMATLGTISLPLPFLDTMIALSILFLAPEILRVEKGSTSLTIHYPWIVAFCFGLVHGLGFASGLTTLGLNHDTLLAALVLFNIGVEIGQLTFIGVALLAVYLVSHLNIAWPRPVITAPAYAIGALAAMWMFSYGSVLFGAAG